MHNVLRTAVVLLGLDNEITEDHLSEDFLEQYQQTSSLPVNRKTEEAETSTPAIIDLPNLKSLEMLTIRKTVQECGGNISAAARKLGICRNTLYRKLNECAR